MKVIVLYPVNDGQTGVGECISSTFHMKASDVMRGQQLFETSQQPSGFDLRGRPSAGVMFFLSSHSLGVHINPFFSPLRALLKRKKAEESHLPYSTYSSLKDAKDQHHSSVCTCE